MKKGKKVYCEPAVLVMACTEVIMAGNSNLTVGGKDGETQVSQPGLFQVAPNRPHQDAEEESNDNPWGDWPQ